MFCRIHNVCKDFIVFHVPTAQRTPNDASVVPFPGRDAKNPEGAIIDFGSAEEFAPYAKDVSFFVRTGQIKLTLEDGTPVSKRDVRAFVEAVLTEAKAARSAHDAKDEDAEASVNTEPEAKREAKPKAKKRAE